MELLGREAIAAISEALTQRLLERFPPGGEQPGLRLHELRYLHRYRKSSQLPQRGHAKSKRSDLRIVGLALLVSLDFHVPAVEGLSGNQHDSVTFVQILEELTQRYQALARDCQSITLVFDKGNNSAAIRKFSTAVVSILSAPWYRRTLPTCWLSPSRNFSRSKTPA